MLPILFSTITEGTVPTHKGVGTLTDCLSCQVTEERNGAYELAMTYAAEGIHASDIQPNSFIMAKPNFTDDPQIFRIYKVGKKINGRFEVNAQHISYDLSGKIISSGTAASCVAACQLLQASAGNFTIQTDKSVTANFSVDIPSSVRSWFGGKAGSLLDVYGEAEWKYNNYACALVLHRGTDRGVTIRYGKNLTELSQVLDMSNLVTGIVPFAINPGTSALTVGAKKSTGLSIDVNRDIAMDFSNDIIWESSTAVATQLSTLVTAYVNRNQSKLINITNSISLNFVQLGEIKDRVDLCDTVHIYFEALGISASAKCIKTVWDVLEDRYISTDFGDAKTDITDSIIQASEGGDINGELESVYQKAKNYTDAVVSTIDADLAEMQSQIDGNITTWYYNYVPTVSNVPASDWTTETEKQKHAGDLFFNNTTQKCYRWTKDNGVWKWILIEDTDIAQALAAAADAYDLADHKRRVFITTPTPPYDVGDLWTNGSDIYYCNTAKTSGQSYSASDWTKATNYVNPTAMQTAINNATALITGNSGGYVVFHDTDNDGKPDEILIMDKATIATATKVWRWNKNGLGYSSTGYSGTYSTAITADGKIVADFITTGTLNAGVIKAGVIKDTQNKNSWDMSSGEFKLAADATVGGSTVSSIASSAASAAVSAQTQADIFNKLTNNGTVQGIVLTNGQLYINASYINAGTLSANLIKAGTLSDAAGNSSIDMTNGAASLKNMKAKRSFELIDENGTRRGYWQYVSSNEPHWAITDANARELAEIWGDANGGNIRVKSGGHDTISLITDSNGKGAIMIYDDSGNLIGYLNSSGMVVPKSLQVHNSNDEIRIAAYTDAYDHGALELRNESGETKFQAYGDGDIYCEKIRQNGGLTALYSGSFASSSTTFSGNFSAIVVIGRPTSGGARVSITIPTAFLSSSAKNFQITDEADYISCGFSISSGKITMAFTSRSSTGYIEAVYGML